MILYFRKLIQIFIFQNKNSSSKAIKEITKKIDFNSNDSGPNSFADITRFGKEAFGYVFQIVAYFFNVNITIHKFRYINPNQTIIISEYYKAESNENLNSFDIPFKEENFIFIYHFGVYEPLVENADNMKLLSGLTTRLDSYIDQINPLDYRAKKLKKHFKSFDDQAEFKYDVSKDLVEIPWREDLENTSQVKKIRYSEYLNDVWKVNCKQAEIYSLSNGEYFYCPISKKSLKIYLLYKVLKDSSHYLKYIFRRKIEHQLEYESCRCYYCGKKDILENLKSTQDLGMIHSNCQSIFDSINNNANGNEKEITHSYSYFLPKEQMFSSYNSEIDFESGIGSINFPLNKKI